MRDLFGYDKVQIAIDRIRQFEPPEGYYLGFSGGKDSCVLKALANLSGVKYDAHMSMTTVDPPEVLNFVREYHPDVKLERPDTNMWKLILYNKMPPTRLVRYCCRELKERGGLGRLVLTGIRSGESHARSKRQMVEQCRTDPRKRYLHPIIDWTKQEIWQFIKDYNLLYCSLYNEISIDSYCDLEVSNKPTVRTQCSDCTKRRCHYWSFSRIGCIMCPMGTRKQRERDAGRYPNFYRAYMRAFGKLVETGTTTWKSADDVMKWWIGNKTRAEYGDKGIFH